VAAGLFLVSLCLASASAGARAAEIILSNDRPHQGETVAVLVRDAALPTGEAPSLKFNKRLFRLFPAARGMVSAGLERLPHVALADTAGSAGVVNDSGGGAAFPSDADQAGGQRQPTVWRTLLAIPADLPPAAYELSYGDAVRKLAVVSGQFPVQKISLPKRVVELTPAPGEMEAVAAAKATLSAERLWTGRFSPPVAARVSSRFGLRRMVNGKLLADYFHSGIDYAAPTGMPVKAPARGKVILAARGFRLHGNIVALDHGQGVVTFYLHLKTVLVKPGQVVKAGEVLGRVGQSGRASGPHLHFSLYVQEVAANPLYWYSRTF
jgi:lysostaphin